MTGCLAAVSASLAASVVHSVVDFVWYIPACMSVTVLLAASAARLADLARGDAADAAPRAATTALARPAWIGLTILVLAIGVWMVHRLAGPAVASHYWDSYLRASIQSTRLARKQMREPRATPAGSVDPDSVARVNSMRADLEEVLYWHPAHARASIRLAGVCLTRFEQQQRTSRNAMDLSQIRDAAIASRFASRGALNEWLDRAVGDPRRLLDVALWHTRRGLALSPLYGEGYLYLAELCFLQGGGADTKAAYVDQALRVRPHDGNILYEAGKEAVLVGDDAEAVAYWRESFGQGGIDRHKLIDLLAGDVDADFFLEHLDPDLPALHLLVARYRALERPDAVRDLLEYLAGKAEQEAASTDDKAAARLWLTAHHAYRELSDPARADASIGQAVSLAPNDYRVRCDAGLWLTDQGQYPEARKHLDWCRRRKPTDHRVARALREAVRGQVRHKRQTMSRRTRTTHTVR